MPREFQALVFLIRSQSNLKQHNDQSLLSIEGGTSVEYGW